MSKQIFILLSLFILCSSYLRPMEKNSKFGDDICKYEDASYEYVRPCEKGKYCLDEDSGSNEFYVCQDLPEAQEGLNTIDEKCSSDFDCESNLKCVGGYCKLVGCADYPIKVSGIYTCLPSSMKAAEGVCESYGYTESPGFSTLDSSKDKFGNPTGKSQFCGLLDFHNMGNQNYDVIEKKYAYVGSVENGKYVSDEILCKSGFALFYYPEGNLKDPYSGATSGGSTNTMYKMCVTPISIDHNDPLLSTQKSLTSSPSSSSCVIYYKEKDDDTTIKKYNSDQLPNSARNPSSPDYDRNGINGIYYSRRSTFAEDLCELTDYEFKIKFQQFKEYTSNLKEEDRDTCGFLEGSTSSYRRYSCNNNALIKSWYFYKNPKNYVVYNNRKKLEVVLNYLIQKEYPSYEFSHILNINYLVILLFLLCL